MRHRIRYDESQLFLIDADDTLWEDNVYFERAISTFIEFLNHPEYSFDQVRVVLNDIERRYIRTHGYGLNCLVSSFVETFEQLSIEPVTPELHRTIHAFGQIVTEHPLELLPGVAETLDYLAGRHRLILVTKGHVDVQTDKLDRSGLRGYFADVEIVREKTSAVYRDIAARCDAHPGSTWMVGNSPRSDINPALVAGLNAVLIPHNQTWMLELEQLAEPQSPSQLLVLERFGDLVQHF